MLNSDVTITEQGRETVSELCGLRCEWEEVAYRWYERILNNEWYVFRSGDAGCLGGDWRLAHGRLDEIAAIIGVDRVREVMQQVEEVFAKEIGMAEYLIWQHGDKAIREMRRCAFAYDDEAIPQVAYQQEP